MPGYNTDVNGVRTSYCSITFGVEGVRLRGIKSINYRQPGEIGKVKSNGVAGPFGRTRGNHMPEGDIEIYQAEYAKVFLPLITRGGIYGFMELAFPVGVAYAEIQSPADTVQDDLVGVRFHSPEISNAEGVEAAFVKLTMDPMDIRWDGKYVALRQR